MKNNDSPDVIIRVIWGGSYSNGDTWVRWQNPKYYQSEEQFEREKKMKHRRYYNEYPHQVDRYYK